MNTFSRGSRLAVAACLAALLGACAHPSHRSNAPVYGEQPPSRSYGAAYGVVRSIDAIGVAQDQPPGAGAVVGGVIGAVIGRQFGGSNSGKNAGTVAGAVGGAIIGNEIEKNARRDGSGVRISVTLDDGSVRRFDFRESGGLRIGDRVRVEGNQLYRLG
jgi:outer membrane lipoprotein SlyB